MVDPNPSNQSLLFAINYQRPNDFLKRQFVTNEIKMLFIKVWKNKFDHNCVKKVNRLWYKFKNFEFFLWLTIKFWTELNNST